MGECARPLHAINIMGVITITPSACVVASVASRVDQDKSVELHRTAFR